MPGQGIHRIRRQAPRRGPLDIEHDVANQKSGATVCVHEPHAAHYGDTAGAVFKRTMSLELVPLELELRLNALRKPQVRQRLAEADRRTGEKMARFIEEQIVASGIRLKIPARDLGDIGRAAIQGLLQYAATDEPHVRRDALELVGETEQVEAHAPLIPDGSHRAGDGRAPRVARGSAT